MATTLCAELHASAQARVWKPSCRSQRCGRLANVSPVRGERIANLEQRGPRSGDSRVDEFLLHQRISLKNCQFSEKIRENRSVFVFDVKRSKYVTFKIFSGFPANLNRIKELNYE